MRIKRIILGILIGTAVGGLLEYFNAFLTFLMPPLRVFLPLAVLIGCLVGALKKGTTDSRLYNKNEDFGRLPVNAVAFIRLVVRKMRYRKKVRQEVQAELAAHFEDALQGCATAEDKKRRLQKLITEFGDAKMLASLLRRAKKRCRPLWRTVAARSFQTAGLLILCLILYTVWFSTGKPTISVDYPAMLNRMSRLEVSNKDNAWPHLERAASLYIDPNQDLKEQIPAFSNVVLPEYRDFAGLPEADRNAITECVRVNEQAWAEFVAASSKSCCYREYGFDPNRSGSYGRMWGIILSPLPEFKNLARVGLWRCRIDIARGSIDDALDNCLAIARNAGHLQKLSTLVEHLVGLALSNLANQEIVRTLESTALTAEQLKDLQGQLAQVYADGYPVMNLEFGKVFFHDLVQRLFTDGGLGGGHLIPTGLAEISNDRMNLAGDDERMFLMPLFVAASMVHARRDKTIEVGDRIYDEQIKLAKMTPYQRHRKNVPSADDILTSLSSRKFSVLYFIVPAFGRASEIAFRGKVSHQATLTILALARSRAEKGEYPASLDQLTAAGLLKDLPMDPYSDNPLIYRKIDQGFILYSAGPNFVDDGGVWGKDSRGEPKNWRDNGDTIFWPVEKPASNQ
jgi:hypothetical protein